MPEATAGRSAIEEALANYPTRRENIPLGWLFTDDYVGDFLRGEGYQRTRSATDRIVKAMAVRFNVDLFQPLTVNKRSARRYAVIDGGARLQFLLSSGVSRDTLVPCEVYDPPRAPEGPEGEGWLYVHLNKERLGLKPTDLFVGELYYGEPSAVRIDAVLRASTGGLTIGPASGDLSCVQSIKELHAHDEANGTNCLADTFRLLVDSGWMGQPKGKTTPAVAGVGLLVRDGADQTRLLGVMRRHTVEEMLSAGNLAVNRAVNRAKGKLLAAGLAQLMNVRVRPDSPSWTTYEHYLSGAC